MTDSTTSNSVSAGIGLLRGLRAVRKLRPDLPEDILRNILGVARWSGSAGNRQPWEFVVVRDREMLRRLSTIDGANAGHLSTAGGGIAIVIHPEVADLDAYDEGRLAERILLAAAAEGLGAAVGHFTGPGDTWAASSEAKRLLGIPEHFVLRETISLGYPAEHLERTPNPPVASLSKNSFTRNTIEVWGHRRYVLESRSTPLPERRSRESWVSRLPVHTLCDTISPGARDLTRISSSSSRSARGSSTAERK